jgi:hypothetical protein
LDDSVNATDVNTIFWDNFQLYPNDPWRIIFHSVNQLNTNYGNAWSAVIIENSYNTGFSFCNYKGPNNNYIWGTFEVNGELGQMGLSSTNNLWTYIAFRTRYEAQGGS